MEIIPQRLPRAVDTARGADVAAAYPADWQALVAGIAGSSGYLAGLLRSERDWLLGLDDPRTGFDALFADLPEKSAALGPALRQVKRRAALLIAVMDIAGLWDLDAVTGALSDLAERAVAAGLAALTREAVARGRLASEDTGLFILGMGKLGARELNYSSDIDLIVLFDDSRHADADLPALRAELVRITQRLVKLIGAVTAEGYVFRTDLRLRPDPSVTPVCLSTSAAESYYESLGRTWERAAMTKARPIAGDLAAGQAFLDGLRPFMWRRALDFAAIADAEEMMRSIRKHKALGGPISFAGHNMKLGRGGIREIEFFAQTQQLIFGGRDPNLRNPRTEAALEALAGAGKIASETAQMLCAAYRSHRMLEHRIQMLDDAQTHNVPQSAERIAALAGLCATDAAALERETLDALEAVHAATALRDEEEAETSGAARLGPQWDQAVEGWMHRPVLRSARSRQIFGRIGPRIEAQLAASGDPEGALRQFDGFLNAQPAGVQLFSLFEAHPDLLALIVDICATAPASAAYLAANARVLDAVLDADFYAPLGEIDRGALQEALARAGEDYEAALDALRRWKQEQFFRIEVQMLRGLASPEAAARACSEVADAVLTGALGAVTAHMEPRYGPPPGRGMAVIGMGKLGSRELSVTSDLDLIVIYDAGAETSTTGPKTVPVTTYYARATQALISALTVPTAQGMLFEVDMRLRPSGRKGPVATSLGAFETYQRDEAWVWEHLALTRARVIAGAAPLAEAVTAAIRSALAQPRTEAQVRAEVQEMRARLFEQKPAGTVWRVKSGPGRLMDIELLTQAGMLLSGCDQALGAAQALPLLAARGWLDAADAEALADAHQLMVRVQQAVRLAGGGVDPTAHAGVAAFLARIADGADPETLAARLTAAYGQAAALIDARLGA